MFLVSAPVMAQERELIPTDYYDTSPWTTSRCRPPEPTWALVVTTVNEEKNDRHRDIWMQALENGRPRGEPFRFTDPTEESSSPVWSPDGSILAFSSRRGDDRNATWSMQVEGPGAEAFHIRPRLRGADLVDRRAVDRLCTGAA